ncbi:MAG TPA: SLC13 family permease, partial [Longimicrobiales bacterium]|nr:SLC13 family permease [Longimicrobiales bacterium]
MRAESKSWRWASVIGAGVLILLLPKPASLQPNAWYILAVFAATMVGLITQPLPGSAMVLIAVAVVAVTGLAPVATALAGYSDPVVWLVLAAFFISRAMLNTGLGRRIALNFIRKLGHTTLGLAYALGFSELVLGSIIPSTGARSGGVIFPIGKSLAEAYDSRPGPTARRLGTFLMLFIYNVNVIVCATFLTGQASNAIIASFARDAAKV